MGQIVELCQQLNVPVVYATSRRRLAVLLRKKHRIGCVGIFYYDGAEVCYSISIAASCNKMCSQAHYKRLMTLVDAARLEYNDRISGLSEQFNLGQESTAESGSLLDDNSVETAQVQYSDIAETINTQCLNIEASEFIPQTLNANAAVFTPSFMSL